MAEAEAERREIERRHAELARARRVAEEAQEPSPGTRTAEAPEASRTAA